MSIERILPKQPIIILLISIILGCSKNDSNNEMSQENSNLVLEEEECDYLDGVWLMKGVLGQFGHEIWESGEIVWTFNRDDSSVTIVNETTFYLPSEDYQFFINEELSTFNVVLDNDTIFGSGPPVFGVGLFGPDSAAVFSLDHGLAYDDIYIYFGRE